MRTRETNDKIVQILTFDFSIDDYKSITHNSSSILSKVW